MMTISCMVIMISYTALAQAHQHIELTEQEQAFLDTLEVIRICTDPDWLPYEGIDQYGQFTGIMSGFHQHWSELIGKKIQVQQTNDWQHALSLIKDKQCEVLSSAHDTPERRDFLTVTKPFIFYPLAVATQPDNNFIVNLNQVMDKHFVMVAGYAAVDIIRHSYPHIKLTTVKSAEQGLKQVEKGQTFAYIDTVPSINYQMFKHGISHLKINGVLDHQYAMSVGIRQDLPLLLSVYDKTIAATTEQTRQRILNNWLSLSVQQDFDRSLLWQILLGIAVVLSLLLYRYFMVNQHNRELQKVNKKLQQLSHSDQLTGMHNRYYLHEAFENELSRYKRYQHGFAIVMLDIDHFKHINDNFGHVTGDDVIRRFGQLLCDHVREQDVVGRWGGEEFLILCPETDLAGARSLAEHLRTLIRRNDFAIDNMNVTASFGVTDYRENEAIEACIQRADQALYQAKDGGRDRTVAY